MWSILFILPNVSTHEPVGNEYISIVPFSDPRVVKIMSRSVFARALIENFEDQFGRPIHPSALIVNDDAPDRVRHLDSVTGFRNAVALSAIIEGHERSLLAKASVPDPLYSDYFDFYPITVSRLDDGFITKSPAVLGFDDEHREFRGQMSPSIGLSGNLRRRSHDFLFKLLQKAWERRFMKQTRDEWSTRTLFRSLEMAYQAASMPFKNNSTIYDYGSSLSLWVSAFEILSHPRTGKANLLSVLALLQSDDWMHSALKKKIYKITYRGKDHRVNLVQRLYKEVYDARNDFLHGNPVKERRLHPFKNLSKPFITRFAPIVYKVALLFTLSKFRRSRKHSSDTWEYCKEFLDESRLSKAILSSR
ncbi:MAG: hypothetical protein ACLQPD_24975 [Desulfomonilaceae bacterium]